MKNEKRLPPVGTIIEKKDRHGKTLAKCEVVEEGIRYGRKTYKSISAAGAAAATALGTKGTTKAGHGCINGFVFWGLTAKASKGHVSAKSAPAKKKARPAKKAKAPKRARKSKPAGSAANGAAPEAAATT